MMKQKYRSGIIILIDQRLIIFLLPSMLSQIFCCKFQD